MVKNTGYVLITAAKNEEKFIGNAIESVLHQTIVPEKWVIVNDGSTDGTAMVVQKYASKNAVIDVITHQPSNKRDFGAKAKAVMEGYASLRGREFDFIGNLDADITFDTSFYEKLMNECSSQPQIGICGGILWEQVDGAWHCTNQNPDWCIGGSTHFFRRKCFEDVGGYLPLRYGGEDTVAEYLARDGGWVVKAFNGIPFYHHRQMGKESGKKFLLGYRVGMQEYHWGSCLLFEIIKCIKRMGSSPAIIGGLSRLLGFSVLFFSLKKREVTDRIASIVRRQQMKRLMTWR